MTHFLTVKPAISDILYRDSGKYSCVILGLPFEISDHETAQYLEPFLLSIVKCLLIRTSECCCHCIVDFDSEVLFNLFCSQEKTVFT